MTPIYRRITLLFVLLAFTASPQAFSSVDSTFHSTYQQRMSALLEKSKSSLLGNISQAIIYADSLLREASGSGNDTLRAAALCILGEAYYYQHDSMKAVRYLMDAWKIYEKAGKRSDIGKIYNDLGIVFARIDSRKSMSYYRRALQIKTEFRDSAGISSVLNNIGVLYEKEMKDFPQAYEYYIRSYRIDQHMGNKEGLATSLLNIGDLNRQMGHYRAAIDSCNRSIDICETNHYDYLKELNFKSLSQSYDSLKDYRNALVNLEKYYSLQLKRSDEESRRQAAEMETRYKTIQQQKEIETVQRERNIQRIIIYLLMLAVGFIVYFMIIYTRKNRKVRKTNDELYQRNQEIEHQRAILREQALALEQTNEELMKLSIVASKTDNSVIVANADGEIEWVNDGFSRMLGIDFEEFKHRYSSNFFTASLHPNIREAVAEAVRKKESFTYSNYTVTRKGREIWIHTTLTPILDENGNLQKIIAIDADVTRIKTAEQELTIKQQELTDSITYAHHIQVSMLPPPHLLSQHLREHFILYRPKDIVSGDFYWFRKRKNLSFLAVADCTGHGIPGAFMSVLGITLLNEIINGLADEAIDASTVLNTLRDNVKTALRQGSDHNLTLDGMDLGLCIFRDNETVMDYSGAYHTLYQLVHDKNGEPSLETYEGNKMPIGVYPNDHLPFTNHHISFHPDDIFYLFTDGYIHQWGGASGKKFNRKRFKELLLSLDGKTLDKQQAMLESTLDEWINTSKPESQNEFQVDDILILGFKL